MSKKYLIVPYEEKDKAKELGCFWDKNSKMWYMKPDSNEDQQKKILDVFEEALPKEIYINVPYKDRYDAKENGAKFNFIEKKWYIPRTCPKNNCEYLKNKYL